jgi:hypothetical protein
MSTRTPLTVTRTTPIAPRVELVHTNLGTFVALVSATVDDDASTASIDLCTASAAVALLRGGGGRWRGDIEAVIAKITEHATQTVVAGRLPCTFTMSLVVEVPGGRTAFKTFYLNRYNDMRPATPAAFEFVREVIVEPLRAWALVDLGRWRSAIVAAALDDEAFELAVYDRQLDKQRRSFAETVDDLADDRAGTAQTTREFLAHLIPIPDEDPTGDNPTGDNPTGPAGTTPDDINRRWLERELGDLVRQWQADAKRSFEAAIDAVNQTTSRRHHERNETLLACAARLHLLLREATSKPTKR